MSQVLSTLGISSVEALLSAIVTLVICIIAIKIVTNIVEKLLARNAKLDATIRHYISSGVRTLLWIIAIIIVANALGINTTSLVALVSVAGLALSLSIQNVMSNLFSAILWRSRVRPAPSRLSACSTPRWTPWTTLPSPSPMPT